MKRERVLLPYMPPSLLLQPLGFWYDEPRTTTFIVMSTWIFTWTRQEDPAAFKPTWEEGWLLQSRPHQTPSSDGALVAHDVLHHRADDRGTYADEIFSFGAQWHMEHGARDEERLRSDLQSSWFSVMANTVERGNRGMAGLVLKSKQCVPYQPQEGDEWDQWRDLYHQSLRELQLDFYDRSDKELWERLFSTDQQHLAAQQCLAGIKWAQETFDSAAWMRQQYDRLREAAGVPGFMGQELHIHLDGTVLSIERSKLRSVLRTNP